MIGWIILGLFVLAIAFWLIGLHVDHAGRSADESLAAVIPWLIAIGFGGAGFLTLIGYALYRLFT